MEIANGEEAFTADEACAILNITRSTLTRYFRDGYLAKLRHRGRNYVPKQAIDDYWARALDTAAKERAQAERRANKASARNRAGRRTP